MVVHKFNSSWIPVDKSGRRGGSAHRSAQDRHGTDAVRAKENVSQAQKLQKGHGRGVKALTEV